MSACKLFGIIRKHSLAHLISQINLNQTQGRIIRKMVKMGKSLLMTRQLPQKDVILNLLHSCFDLKWILPRIISIFLSNQFHTYRVHVKVLSTATLIKVMAICVVFGYQIFLLTHFLLQNFKLLFFFILLLDALVLLISFLFARLRAVVFQIFKHRFCLFDGLLHKREKEHFSAAYFILHVFF